jgi:GNAT superfamily N-acetyltransferase
MSTVSRINHAPRDVGRGALFRIGIDCSIERLTALFLQVDQMSEPAISVTASPTQAELDAIGGGLAAFNDSDVGPANRIALAVVVRDDTGAIVAGVSGYTAWGWLYLQWLWVAEAQRGQRLAGRMLALAEDEARVRGCHASYIDTFNPVALKTYERAGYSAFGRLDDFPTGRTRTFLQKQL